MKLCVILPVYNAAKYLEMCLDSLLNQTFSDFIIIAVNDASTDNSGKILDEYASKDSRVLVFHFSENKGDPVATQFALELLRYMNIEFVARMDADDICLLDRFEKQITFLEQNPEIDILGGQMQNIDENGIDLESVSNVPLNDDMIKVNFLLASANILNPTAMWRNSVISSLPIRYDIAETACDYGMWIQLSAYKRKFANLPDILVKYRIHSNQSSQKVDKVHRAVGIILPHYLHAIFPELSPDDIKILTMISNGRNISLSIESFKLAIQAYSKVLNRSVSVIGENRAEVIKIFDERMSNIQQAINAYYNSKK